MPTAVAHAIAYRVCARFVSKRLRKISESGATSTPIKLRAPYSQPFFLHCCRRSRRFRGVLKGLSVGRMALRGSGGVNCCWGSFADETRGKPEQQRQMSQPQPQPQLQQRKAQTYLLFFTSRA